MRIISLSPFITETIFTLGLETSLVGISHDVEYPKGVEKIKWITVDRNAAPTWKKRDTLLETKLASGLVDLDLMASLKPDIILTSLDPTDGGALLNQLRNNLSSIFETVPKLLSFFPTNLDKIYESFARLGKELGAATQGHELASRVRAQFMDWADNFYDRTKNKKVSFIGGYNPLLLSGLWIPDMIKTASAVSHNPNSGEGALAIGWEDLVSFKPDVIIFAPHNRDLTGSMKLLGELEKLPQWEQVPAVKRGEFFFVDGRLFISPGPRIIEAMSIIESAIAGIDSGYISARGSFQRLRYVELHRHKL